MNEENPTKALYDEIEEEMREVREKLDSLSEFIRKNRKEILKMKMGLELYAILVHRGQLLISYLSALKSEKIVLSLEQTDDYPKSEGWNW